MSHVKEKIPDASELLRRKKANLLAISQKSQIKPNNRDSGYNEGIGSIVDQKWFCMYCVSLPTTGPVGPTGPPVSRLYIAVGSGNNGSILYSSDGITWAGTTGLNFDTGSGGGVAAGPMGYVAVGINYDAGGSTGPSILYSSDGITWAGTTGLNFDTGAGNGVG